MKKYLTLYIIHIMSKNTHFEIKITKLVFATMDVKNQNLLIFLVKYTEIVFS